MSSLITVVDSDAGSFSGTTPEATAPLANAWSDWVGMAASIGCAIHCAAMPFVIAYLPALGLSFLADEAFHKWMAVACFVVALVAFIPGIRKHGRWTPVVIASVGLTMISVAAFGFAGECCPSCDTAGSAAPTGAVACTVAGCTLCPSHGPTPSEVGPDDPSATLATNLPPTPWVSRIAPLLTPIGGIVLVSAHLLNRRYGCLCGCCGIESSEEVDR